jgi:hypothetical protein
MDELPLVWQADILVLERRVVVAAEAVKPQVPQIRARETMSRSKQNFVLQQGLETSPQTCEVQYGALRFQPWLVMAAIVVGIVFQSTGLALSAVLGWSALFPRWNPFDLLYNRAIGRRRDRFTLPPAPGPRRFAQGLAGVLALAIGVSLWFEWRVVAYSLEAFLATAVAALAFGRFCLGSFVYHLLRGRSAFARRTLPWGPGL